MLLANRCTLISTIHKLLIGIDFLRLIDSDISALSLKNPFLFMEDLVKKPQQYQQIVLYKSTLVRHLLTIQIYLKVLLMSLGVI